MKTLQLNQKNFSIRSMMLLILLLIATTIFSQHKNDSTRYLPQISLTATNGFGPYIIGTMQENTFTVSDLPEETSKVILRFIDADSIQIGSSHIETGISLTSVSWSVHMDSLNLPLSPQFNIEITYKTDSIAKYYIAYAVYPDTIHILASEGWVLLSQMITPCQIRFGNLSRNFTTLFLSAICHPEPTPSNLKL